jgi:chaperone BCS1
MSIIETCRRYITNNIYDFTYDYVKNKSIYRIDISLTNDSELFDGLPSVFKNIPVITFHNYRSNESRSGYIRGYTNFIIFKNTPIFIKIHTMNIAECGDKDILTLYTINIDKYKNRLREFVDKMYTYIYKHSDNKAINNNRYITMGNANGMDSYPLDDVCRGFDTIFIPQHQKEILINHLNYFIHNRKAYINNNIPYHTGILLYGAPGTGKTSIIRGLINIINPYRIKCCTGDSFYSMIQNGCLNFYHGKYNENIQLVIVEDIDCDMFIPRGDKSKVFVGLPKVMGKEKSNDSSISAVLNALDGLTPSNNNIFIFTTNHIENLDPALIRPGRIDLKLEITHPNKETINMFLNKYYKKELPSYINEVKDDLSFGELQLYALKNTPFDDIINIIKK